MTGPWHDGHILGGYQNPACPSCLREQRKFDTAREIDRQDGIEPECEHEYRIVCKTCGQRGTLRVSIEEATR